MTTDLAAWLLEQIAADEAVENAKREIVPDPERPNPFGHDVWYSAGRTYDRWDNDITVAYGNWLAAQPSAADPFRFAECSAKRAIVELAQIANVWWQDKTGHAAIDAASDASVIAYGFVLRLLAQPYVDRPGFDPAWKVETREVPATITPWFCPLCGCVNLPGSEDRAAHLASVHPAWKVEP